MNIDFVIDRNVPLVESFSRSRHRAACKPAAAPRCLRCGGQLCEGFLFEQPQGYDPVGPVVWQRGPVEPVISPEPPRSGDQPRWKVIACRCADCGTLDLSAP